MAPRLTKSINMETLALAQGSICPPRSLGTLRIYNMRFCPFAQRALLILFAKNLDHEIVNVNLRHKPDWFLALNPAGLVPVLEQDGGRVLAESLVVSEYLDDTFDGTRKILPSDPYKRAEQKLLVAWMSGLVDAFMGLKKRSVPMNRVVSALQLCEGLLKSNFYGGPTLPGWADYMIWPWLERIGSIGHLVDDGPLVPNLAVNLPKLDEYIRRMSERPEVGALLRRPEDLLRFDRSLLNKNPEYDIGLDHLIDRQHHRSSL